MKQFKLNMKLLLCLLMAAVLITGVFTGCSDKGENDPTEDAAKVEGKFVGDDETDDEPLSEADDEWVEGEDFLGEDSPTSFTDDEVKGYVSSALGKDYVWSGDYKSFTDEQKAKIEAKFSEDGYTVKVTDSGITYLSYTPKLKGDEVKDIINETLGDGNDPYEWSGKYSDLTDEEKRKVSEKIQESGIDAVVTDDGIYYSSDHENDVEVVDGIVPIEGVPSEPVVKAALVEIDTNKYKNWSGDYSIITDEERSELATRLKEVGFNVFFLDDGPIYLGGWLGGKDNGKDDGRVSVTGVSLDSDKLYLAVSEAKQFTATVIPNNATNSAVTWASSNENVARISTTGLVRGYAAGSTVITATTQDGGFVAKCTVNVLATAISAKSVSVSEKKLSLAVGDSSALVATVSPENATNTSISWSSSDEKIATVSSTGLVFAKAAGKAEITAKTKDGGYTDKCEVTVTTPIEGISKTFGITFGGTNSDKFDKAASTQDGGYVVLGNYFSTNEDYAVENKGGDQKSSIIKFSADGDKKWIKVIGGSEGVTFYDIAELTDGSIVAVGTTLSKTTYPACETSSNIKPGTVDALIIKYSSSGELEWFKSIRGSKGEYFSSVAATPDGGFVVGGKVESSDGDFAGLSADIIKAVVIKYNKNCEPQWKRALNGSRHNNVLSIDVNAAGYVYFACVTASVDGDFEKISAGVGYDAFVFKVSKNGELKWHKSLSGTGYEEYSGIACTGDGGCVAVGTFGFKKGVGTDFYTGINTKGKNDAAAVKLSADGNVDWIKTFGGTGDDHFTDVAAINGGYAVVGYTDSSDSSFSSLGNKGKTDSFVIVLNANGEKLSMTAINGSLNDRVAAVCALEDRTHFTVVGFTESSDNSFKGMKKPGENKHISFMFGYKVAG